jgi:hypothetical protein
MGTRHIVEQAVLNEQPLYALSGDSPSPGRGANTVVRDNGGRLPKNLTKSISSMPQETGTFEKPTTRTDIIPGTTKLSIDEHLQDRKHHEELSRLADLQLMRTRSQIKLKHTQIYRGIDEDLEDRKDEEQI